MHYYDPSPTENVATTTLIGKRICIFWDGEMSYYAAEIRGFNPATGLFQVVYVDDEEPRPLYDEDLTTAVWKIWRGPIKMAAPPAPVLVPTRGNASRACRVEDYSSMFNDGTITDKQGRVSSSGPQKRAKLTYENMVAEAVFQIADNKHGASLGAVRKYIENAFNVGNLQAASFNKKTLDGVNTGIANKRIEKMQEKGHTYRPTMYEKVRKREEDEEKRRKAQEEVNRSRSWGTNKSSCISTKEREKDDYELNVIGTAVENNRGLRQALIDQRQRRDSHLEKNFDLLKPFLPEKNYFRRKEIREQKIAMKLEQQATQGGGSSTGVAAVSSSSTAEKTAAAASSSSSSSSAFPNSEDDKASVGTVADDADAANVSANANIPTIDAAQELDSALNGVKMLTAPVQLTAELHEHQVQGISWMVHMYQKGMPMLLGDQMGLGKTLQTIGFFAYLKYKLNAQGPYLVVVPLSVLSNWLTEINRFCPTLRAVRFHGPKDERARLKSEELGDLQDFDVVVTTYEVMVGEANWLKRKYMWTSIVIDEGHRLKNEKSQLSEKLRSLPCLCKVILSGTPLQNNLRELWALLHFLAPDVFNNATSEKFTTGFDVTKNQIDNRILRLSRRLLGAFMLRRLKDHVAITLPSRRELTVLVPLTQKQIILYKRLLCGLDKGTLDVVMSSSSAEEGVSSSNSSGGGGNAVTLKKSSSSSSVSNADGSSSGVPMGDSDWRKLMNLLLQLRKICNHTYLMPDIAPDPYVVTEDIVQGSGKLQMLDRLLPKLKTDGHRVLIFSQFTSMLDLLEDYCEFRDHPFARLDGETNRVQRRLDCRRFNAVKSPLFIFLISTRAGGLGLNLATADTVILYDSDWNPQVDLQAMERAHRIGQTKPVRVFRLVCRGSIEERMINRAEKKLYLNAMVAERSDEQIDDQGDIADAESAPEAEDVSQALGIGKSAMSKGELASLIRFGANAVVESEQGQEMPEDQLDRLLERQGRDKPYPGSHASLVAGSSSSSPSSSSGSSSDSAVPPAPADLEAELQGVLKKRMEKLKEIDLRQLGSTYYASSKDRKKSNKGEDIGAQADSVVWVGEEEADPLENVLLGGKRSRTERITMVTSAGSGYGGAIPTLAYDWDDQGTAVATQSSLADRRSRNWHHQEYCCLCAKRRVHEGDNMLKCVHCPKVFHESCLAKYDIAKSAMGFICPHHKCQSCTRGTAAAGGLLFRCVNCLTSYCEDCLPDEEVESVGRCRALEELGYHAKQAYYIKCSPCCVDDGIEATGVHGDALLLQEKEFTTLSANVNADSDQMEVDGEGVPPSVTAVTTTDSQKEAVPASAPLGEVVAGDSAPTPASTEFEGGNEAAAEEEEEEEDFFLTQYMKVKWEEETDSEDERERKREEAKRIRAEKRAAAKAAKLAAAAAGSSAKKKKKTKASVKDAGKEEKDQGRKRRAATNSNAGKKSKKPKKGIVEREPSSDSEHDADVESEKTQEASGSNDEEEEEEEAEEEEEDEYWVSLDLGDSSVSYERSCDILVEHPSFLELERIGGMSSRSVSLLSSMRDKATSGRYRSKKAFVADISYFLGELSISNKKAEFSVLRNNVQAFFERYIEIIIDPNL
jgi:SWI/SNF-related matrix-associated actin-dependent regulator of chromatin subfamily A member 5